MIITTSIYERIKALPEGSSLALSVDFGTQKVVVKRCATHAFIKDMAVSLTLKLKENFCYLIDDEGVNPIAFFSEDTNRFYKLIATKDWPSFAIGSVPMHRIRGLSPKEDTANKVRLTQPKGRVLDTCMGLGYTAIGASLKAKEVHTFEIDENVVFLAELNPHSRALFTNKNITIYREDISEYVTIFKEGFFDCIVHDPPTPALSRALYTVDFYRELLRVLTPGGRLFHYAPLWGIKRGIDFPSKIKRKLQQAGFVISGYFSNQSAIVCYKPRR